MPTASAVLFFIVLSAWTDSVEPWRGRFVSSHFPLVVSFLALMMFLLMFAFRRKQMQKAGTWMGPGSLECEDRWNLRKKKRKTMLLAAGIAEDDPKQATLLGLKWAELPPDRRRQIFEHDSSSRWFRKSSRK